MVNVIFYVSNLPLKLKCQNWLTKKIVFVRIDWFQDYIVSILSFQKLLLECFGEIWAKITKFYEILPLNLVIVTNFFWGKFGLYVAFFIFEDLNFFIFLTLQPWFCCSCFCLLLKLRNSQNKKNEVWKWEKNEKKMVDRKIEPTWTTLSSLTKIKFWSRKKWILRESIDQGWHRCHFLIFFSPFIDSY